MERIPRKRVLEREALEREAKEVLLWSSKNGH
jgi:hypothetical protein